MKQINSSNDNQTKIPLKSGILALIIISVIPLAICGWFMDNWIFQYEGVSKMFNLSLLPALLYVRTMYSKEPWFKNIVDNIGSIKELTVRELIKKVMELLGAAAIHLIIIAIILACVVPIFSIIYIFFKGLF